MTLMYWLKLGHGVGHIEGVLRSSAAVIEPALGRLQQVLERNRQGCERIARMVGAGVDTDQAARSPEEGLAFCRRLFDWSVSQSAESSVALYSLGNADLLAAATREVVQWLQRQQLISRSSVVLEIGCGIGRFEAALAPLVGSIHGIDVSPAMIEEARRRCVGLDNVELRVCEGRDLRGVADRSVDLVLAVDSFPYLFQSGRSLVLSHFLEAQRVLRPGGALCILEMSYGRTLTADVEDFRLLSGCAMLQPGPHGTQPFRSWDGIAFLAFKAPESSG
ncbi:MAG: hypothetical protein JWQ73_1133 [Variovorax sp.]|nr:hypothetical protein [Variovorax sp.]